MTEPKNLTSQQWSAYLASNAYSLAELKALCGQLQVDHENLPHTTKIELSQALVQHLDRRQRLPDLATADTQRTSGHSESLASYRQQVLAETQYLELKGIPLPQRRDGRPDTPPIPLDKIYIQLQAVADKEQRRHERAETEALERKASPKSPFDVLAGLRTLGEYFYRQGKVYEAAERPQPVDPQTALAEQKRLVILGAPGAGKSTLLRYLARRTAERESGQIPIHISLRDFAVAYDNNRMLTLREYALQRVGGGAILRLALGTAIEQGRVLWLLDGLDETRLLADEISRQASQLPGGLLLTSRPVGYSGSSLHNLPHFEVLPLTPDKVAQFLHDWMAIFAEEGEGETAVAERVTALQEQLGERPQLQVLTRNPLLLTFMVVLSSLKGTPPLPHKRADLYALYLEQLQAWEMGRLAQASSHPNAFEFRVGVLTGEKAKKVVAEGLNYLGWALFLNYYGGRATQVPTPDTLIQQVADYLAQDGYGEGEDLGKEVLAFWREAGMLDIWELEGHEYLAFRHFTFLEYAAAWGLRRAWERNEKGTWQFLKPRLHHPAWREPILLWGGGLPSAGIDKVLSRLRRGVSFDENILHRDLLLAAALLAENLQVKHKVAEKIVRRLVWLGRSHAKKQLLVLILIWLGIPFCLLFIFLPFGWGLLISIIWIALFTSIIVIPRWLDIKDYYESSSNSARFEKQISSIFTYFSTFA